MDRTDRLEARSAGHAAASLAGIVDSVFESFVSADTEDPREREAQARAIGCLSLLGFGAAAMAPVAVFTSLGLALSFGPLAVAGALLAAAGLVAATGRVEPVILTLFSLACLAVGVGSAALGLPLAALALMIAPIETALAGRRRLALSMLPAVLAGAGIAIAAALVTGRPVGLGAGLAAPALGLMALYGVRLALCASQAAARRRVCGTQDRAEAALVESLLSGALIRLDGQGGVVETPEAARDMFGGRIETGQRLVETIHLLDRLAFLSALADLRDGSASADCAVRVLGAEGAGERFLALHLAASRDRDGRLARVLCVARDASASREADRRLTAAMAEADEASKAKSRFLAAVSHELRTPLNAIIGFTDILEQEFFGGFESPRQKEYVGLIGRSGQHLLQVVNGLLDISKIEAGRYEIAPERFSIGEAMQAAVAMVRDEAEKKGLTVLVHQAGEGAEFVADRRACQQILLNLLSNAVKFTDHGTISVSVVLEAGRQILKVADTGIGIEAGDLHRIAQPFVQVSAGLSRRYQGTGLGLSLAKGLCELHHGSLEIASRPGIGTVVSAIIPDDCAERLASPDNINQNVVTLRPGLAERDAGAGTAPEVAVNHQAGVSARLAEGRALASVGRRRDP